MPARSQKFFVFLLLAAMLGIYAGCVTTGPYRLKQTQNDVDFAMTRYQNRVAFGSVAPSFQSQVAPLYQAYKAAFDTAVEQAHANYDAPTPANVEQLADQLLNTLASIPMVP